MSNVRNNHNGNDSPNFFINSNFQTTQSQTQVYSNASSTLTKRANTSAFSPYSLKPLNQRETSVSDASGSHQSNQQLSPRKKSNQPQISIKNPSPPKPDIILKKCQPIVILDFSFILILVKEMKDNKDFTNIELFIKQNLNQDISDEQKAQLYIILADALERQGKPCEVQEVVVEALNIRDITEAQMGELLVKLSNAYYEQMDFVEAIKIAQGALMLLDNLTEDLTIELSITLFRGYLQEDQFLETQYFAQALLQSGGLTEDQELRLSIILAEAFCKQNKYRDAQTVAHNTLKLPNLSVQQKLETYRILCITYQEDNDKLYTYIKTLQEKFKNAHEALSLPGLTYYQKTCYYSDLITANSELKNKEQGYNEKGYSLELQQLEQEILKQPNFTDTQKAFLGLVLSDAFHKEGQYLKAQVTAQESLSLKLPNTKNSFKISLSLYEILVTLFVEQNQYNDVQDTAQKALKLPNLTDTQKAELYLWVAFSFFTQGQYHAAENALQEALTLPNLTNLDNIRLNAALSEAFNEQGEYDDAQKTSQKALFLTLMEKKWPIEKQWSSNITIALYTTLCKAFNQQNKYYDAQQTAQEALKLPFLTDTQRTSWYVTLSKAFYKQGKYNNAQNTAQEALKLPYLTDTQRAELDMHNSS